ncbi:unnamed protein product [Moneuplotes crassus]|uniref:L-2-hydroxyglutarate dehydrogenase, mitochondrial n=1 Tax=Euplotes crassus TaxID=5936 RepID=A0AAD1ULE0_EUPCR|nr:unnamed protein product [Moneuplotes crassus]
MYKRYSQLKKLNSDFLILGAGIIGLNVAKAIYRTYPKAIVRIIEKEHSPGLHASGRNSGVIHAGIYYSTDSMKAKFCREGNRAMTQYCKDNHLDFNNCGKFIVASNEREYQELYSIYKQGIENGIDIQLMSRTEAMKREPLLRGYGEEVIWSPSTSVANPRQVIKCLSNEIREKYGKYCSQFYNTEILKLEKSNQKDCIEVASKDFLFESKYLINCTGQQALGISKKFLFSNFYNMLPVKGNYLISDMNCSDYVKTLVYPVPMKDAHFLGVHSTITPTGHIKVGPSATPAFGIENYNKLEKVKPNDLFGTIGKYASLLFSSQAGMVTSLAFQELPKLSKNKMLESVRKIHDVPPCNYSWYPPGIRSQLYDVRTKKFLSDFRLEYDGFSMHVLNTVSPGWTCSSPFADHIVSKISKVFRLDN